MKKRFAGILVLLVFILVCGFFEAGTAYAASESVSVYEIDYDNETLKVKANSGDTKIFFASSSSSSKWDVVYGELDSNKMITMDISWASKSSNVVFYLKGDVSDTPVKVTLPKQSSSFKASLNVASNTVNFSNLGTETIVYWRKSVSSAWTELDTASASAMKDFQNQLERFSLQGITLYFRTKQVMGSAEAAGARPSKEVKLTVSKRAAAPSVAADYSKLTISAKEGMEYKKSDSGEWMAVSGSSLSILTAAPELINGSGSELEEVSIDVRTKATSSKVASQTTTLVIPAQEDTDGRNIAIQYSGSAQCRLSISDLRKDDNTIELKGASSSNIYEYTIVKSDEIFNVSQAAWTSVATTEPVNITSTKAPKGSTVYIRKRATSTALATKPVEIVIGDYPDSSSINGITNLDKISGVEKSMVFSVKLPEKAANAAAKVSSISFGGKKAVFTQSEAVKSTDGSDYIITVTITDTTEVEAVAANIGIILDGIVTLSNGDVIESGVTLTITPAATVKGSNISLFKDVSASENSEITVSLGDKTKSAVRVTGITANDIAVDFTQSDVNTEYQRVITISKDKLDSYSKALKTSQYGSAANLVITLDNGEVIKSTVTVTVKMPVTISSSSTGMGISISSYKKNMQDIEDARKAKEAAIASGSTVSIPTVTQLFEDPVLTINIDSSLYAKDQNYIVSSVTWEDTNILSIMKMNGSSISVTLDVSKIVETAESSGADSISKMVVIKLKSDETNSEIVLDNAYKITVVK